MLTSPIGRQAVADGFASEAEIQWIADGFRAWADEPDGWFAVLHGELICRV
jgi:hypothetical protein